MRAVLGALSMCRSGSISPTSSLTPSTKPSLGRGRWLRHRQGTYAGYSIGFVVVLAAILSAFVELDEREKLRTGLAVSTSGTSGLYC